MISSKKELKKYIKIERIMNGEENRTLKTILFPNRILSFLKEYRKTEYYGTQNGLSNKLLYLIHRKRSDNLMIKLGFSIAYNVFGYGLIIPHHGTIVVGAGNTIGKFCVLHTSTCITSGHKIIGDGLYLSSGAKIIKDISLGNYISVGANSVVNKDFLTNNCFIAGMPAEVIKESQEWYKRDGESYTNKVARCRRLMEDE